MYPLISAIIPTKNEEKNIARCLKSIANQNYKGAIEIIVVDNHSSDKTVEIAKQFTKYVLIHGNERSEQRNRGAEKAKGQWLLFIDADMQLENDVIASAVAMTQKRLSPICIAIQEKAIGTSFLTKSIALEKNCYNTVQWLIAARFFPRKEFLQLSGYDEDLIAGEDWAITQEFQEKGYEIIILKTTYIIHHEGKIGLKKLLQKEIYYIQNINLYAQKYPKAFSNQSSISYRMKVWIHSWRDLIKHPLLTVTFLCYKWLVWILWSISQKPKAVNQNK